jgi:hypothetical protein
MAEIMGDGCVCRATRRLMVPIALHGSNVKACEKRRGERFAPGEPCHVIDRRKKSDVDPPRTARASGGWRVGIPVTHS